MQTVIALKDLFSAEGRRDPYPFYADLHRLGQASPLDPAVDRYSVVVHGYEAIERLMRDSTFRMLDAAYLDQLDRRPEPLWRRRPSLQVLQQTVFFLNPPEHARLRRPLAQAFTARRMARLEPAIVRLIDRRLDHLEEMGAGGRPVDFMALFAYPLPSDVIGELVGVPEEDRAWFPARSEPFSLVLEPGPQNWRYLQAGDAAAGELTAYFADLIAARRAAPRDDLTSALLQAQASGEAEFSDAELVSNLIGLYNAGFLTSVHSIGNGLILLLDRPEAHAELTNRPELAPAYVEEILRFKTPVQFGVRWAAADTEIMGVPVPAGGEALVLLGAANRDPRRFADPDVFDPSRPDNHPMSFSVGPHYCLGAALSRLEIQLALPMVLRRFPRLSLAGPPRTLDLMTFHGYQEIPVTIS
ncbi:cytochrome P450 [Dactylosporangium sp. NPDC048998]|uniref:cytochrome P450 n=1 Tax=Dactylosporangium sp. NPDC048998 TaxID=3363976 RepID=UPI003716F172